MSLTSFSRVNASNFSIKLMAATSSSSVYRGASIWKGKTAMIGPMFIFYKKVFLAGPNLYYSFFPKNKEEQHELKIGGRLFDDDKPWLRLDDTALSFRNTRKGSFESYMQYAYKFGFLNKFQLGAFAAKELIEHKGIYTEFYAVTPLFPYTSIKGTLGIAEKSSAEYLYGQSSSSGYSHFSLMFTGVLLHVPWDGVAMINIKNSWVLQGANKQGRLVRGDSENLVATIRLLWNAL
jgi:hypothetical protein